MCVCVCLCVCTLHSYAFNTTILLGKTMLTKWIPRVWIRLQDIHSFMFKPQEKNTGFWFHFSNMRSLIVGYPLLKTRFLQWWLNQSKSQCSFCLDQVNSVIFGPWMTPKPVKCRGVPSCLGLPVPAGDRWDLSLPHFKRQCSGSNPKCLEPGL